MPLKFKFRQAISDKSSTCTDDQNKIQSILKFKLKYTYQERFEATNLVRLIAYLIKNNELELEDIIVSYLALTLLRNTTTASRRTLKVRSINHF